MSQHLEPGTQDPMRPAVAICSVANSSAFLAPNDTPAVDWTAAGTRIQVDIDSAGAFDSAMMNEGNWIAVSGGNLVLREGLYEIQLHPGWISTDVTNDGTVRMALTNSDGSTVHVEGKDREVPANEVSTPKDGTCLYFLTHILEVTSPDTTLVIRGAETGGTASSCGILEDHMLCKVRKIANLYEFGTWT